MKIRLMGTKQELDYFITTLPIEVIIHISKFYFNRNNHLIGRVYLEVEFKDIDYYV